MYKVIEVEYVGDEYNKFSKEHTLEIWDGDKWGYPHDTGKVVKGYVYGDLGDFETFKEAERFIKRLWSKSVPVTRNKYKKSRIDYITDIGTKEMVQDYIIEAVNELDDNLRYYSFLRYFNVEVTGQFKRDLEKLTDKFHLNILKLTDFYLNKKMVYETFKVFLRDLNE